MLSARRPAQSNSKSGIARLTKYASRTVNKIATARIRSYILI
jgi:hypothetical protein